MRKTHKILLFALSLCTGLFLLSHKPAANNMHLISDYYQTHLQSLDSCVRVMQEKCKQKELSQLRNAFFSARYFYKKTEFAVGYFYPNTELKINGAPLVESEASMPNELIFPTGFQVLEEVLFAENLDYNKIRNEIDGIQSAIRKLQTNSENFQFTASNTLDALKLNLYRLITKGITGFDAPITFNSLPEAVATLESTKEVIILLGHNHSEISIKIDQAIAFIHASADFDSFDRARFIRQHINPICEEIHCFYKAADIVFDTNYPKAVASDKMTLFEENAIDWRFFAPSDALLLDSVYTQLGEKLFYDNLLSSDQSRSCGSCHQPDKAFTDGLPKNVTLGKDGFLLRNTPTLLYAAYQPAQFYDRRVTYLEDQIHDVVSNEAEMDGDFNEIVANIKQNKKYQQLFKEALGKNAISERNVKRLLASYIRTLGNFSSDFDEYMKGNEEAMSEEAVSGFNLFMGKAKCGTCHFMPLFNGTLPPHWNKIEVEVLGVPSDTLNTQLDEDKGAYNLHGALHHLHAFKTTTVRNAAHTAPYMHNGIFATLEEVIDFYNLGGGIGLGLELENQTLPEDELNLSAEEKSQIINFLKALSDK